MRQRIRDVGFGVAVVATVLWMTFFATPGAVEVATLTTAAVALVWFATVDVERLVDTRRRPQLVLFALAVLATALLVTASAVISSGTIFLTLAVGTVALGVGLTRAIRHGMTPPVPEE